MIRRRFERLEIILQMGARALRTPPSEFKARLASYDGLVDAALADPSEGYGIPFALDKLLPIYEAVLRVLPQVNLVIAGGLSDLNIDDRLTQLHQALGRAAFSIDAEGGLREDTPEHQYKVFSPLKAAAYLQAATVFFR